MMATLYIWKDAAREEITYFLLWLVRKLNKSSSRVLSQNLWEMAEDYNTRPGTDNYYKERTIE